MASAHYGVMIQRASFLEAASSHLDERARQYGNQLASRAITTSEAVANVLSAAVESGVVDQMCARHHRGLARAWGFDEVTAAVTSMLAQYALDEPGCAGHLDPTRFADGTASAAGWVGKVIGSMRTTRILREMRADTRELASPLELEQLSVHSAEDAVLAGAVPLVDESTRGLPATSATIRLVHASALHQLLGLPPLRPWNLTDDQRVELLEVLEQDPDAPHRVLAGNVDGTGGTVGESIGQLWAGWNQDDVAAMLALTTPGRDIPRVLASATLRPLPRPTARSGYLERLRARARDGVPVSVASVASKALEVFLDCRVEMYTDFDRIRRPPTAAEAARREASRAALPALLREASQQIGIGHLDVLSGLIALFIDPLHVADPVYFTPTSWRFPA